MVQFEKYLLENGLRIILHRDNTTPLVAVNLLYDVGARDEHPDQTGFAHLFEHLMFEGSCNIPDYDKALQLAGGENNAFTTNDITNYYLTIPGQNIETAFWLESDRMLELAFSDEKLTIQKNVVTEEFKQSYLNQPYGDVWMLLRSLVYKEHPYQWPTIGKSIEHVQNATLQQVRSFFYQYYRPNNAILTLSGNLDKHQVLQLADKWFGDIPKGNSVVRNLPEEPFQTETRRMVVERDVPFDEIYIAFHTSQRLSPGYYTSDILSDILASGHSSRLKENLVKKKKIFSEANAWITGNIDKGMFVVMGKLHKGKTLQEAEEAIWNELEGLKQTLVKENELLKVKNKIEASHTYSETSILSKAMNLSYYELLGDAAWLNNQNDHYFNLTEMDIQLAAKELFQREKASILHYLAKNS